MYNILHRNCGKLTTAKYLHDNRKEIRGRSTRKEQARSCVAEGKLIKLPRNKQSSHISSEKLSVGVYFGANKQQVHKLILFNMHVWKCLKRSLTTKKLFSCFSFIDESTFCALGPLRNHDSLLFFVRSLLEAVSLKTNRK